MPYSWETKSWRDRIQIEKLVRNKGSLWMFHSSSTLAVQYPIPLPTPSGLCASLSTEEIPGLLDKVTKADKEKLMQMFEHARREERNRKMVTLDSTMKEIDSLIKMVKSREIHTEDCDGVAVADLQGLWYILNALIGEVRVLETFIPQPIKTFMDAYWSVLCPALKEHLKEEKPLLEQLICYPGIGSVNPAAFLPGTKSTFQNEDFQECLSQFFKKLSDAMPPGYGFAHSQVGSIGEGCKIGYADEYDCRLEFHIDIASALNGNTSVENITKVCMHSQPSAGKIFQLFTTAVRKMCPTKDTEVQDNVNECLKLIGCGHDSKVPWVLFRWQPDLMNAEENNNILVKVDCALTIRCRGVWPGDKSTDPLGNPIEKLAHILVPDVIGHKEWSWSVCHAQQTFFRSLKKYRYVHLGYIICKIICSCALHPDECHPPSTFCLKTCLFNAIANGDITMNEDVAQEDLLGKAIQVADAILAGLEKTLLEYFYDGEPVEHIQDYQPMWCSNFLPMYLLKYLVEDFVKYQSNTNYVSIKDLMPFTLSCIRGDSISNLNLVRNMLGLLNVKNREKDTWKRIAEEAGNKWFDKIPQSIHNMWCDAAHVELGLNDRCLARGLEATRRQVARYNLASLDRKGEHDHDLYKDEAMMLMHILQKHLPSTPSFISIGEGYLACQDRLNDMVMVLSRALTVDCEDRQACAYMLIQFKHLFDVAPSYAANNSALRREMARGHIVDLTNEQLSRWKSKYDEIMCHETEDIWETQKAWTILTTSTAPKDETTIKFTTEHKPGDILFSAPIYGRSDSNGIIRPQLDHSQAFYQPVQESTAGKGGSVEVKLSSKFNLDK